MVCFFLFLSLLRAFRAANVDSGLHYKMLETLMHIFYRQCYLYIRANKNCKMLTYIANCWDFHIFSLACCAAIKKAPIRIARTFTMHVCGFWKCSISERTIQMMQNCRKTSKKEEGEKKNSPKCNNNKNTKRNFSILCLASAKIKWKLQLTYMKVSIGFSVHFRSVRSCGSAIFAGYVIAFPLCRCSVYDFKLNI